MHVGRACELERLWWPELSDPLELELQAIVSCLTWELNAEPLQEQYAFLTTGVSPAPVNIDNALSLLSHFTV